MAQITRSTKVGGGTTLQSNTLARAADVETDVLTLFSAHNNHDTGTSKWTVVSAQGSSSVPLVADNSTGTQNIVEFKDNGTTVWSVADGGSLVSVSKKITGLADGTATGEALNYGQVFGVITSYRRPNLTHQSITTVDVEPNTGTSNQTKIIFPDGNVRTVTEDTSSTNKYRRFDITATAQFTSGTEDSGLRSGISETTNTWYAIYAVKSLIDSTKFVLVGDTTLPTSSNVSTLDGRYGSNSWVYLGTIRNGDNVSATGDIIKFKHVGNACFFSNIVSGAVSHGIRFANGAGVTSLTYTVTSGTGTTDIPTHVQAAYWQGTGNSASTNLSLNDSAGTNVDSRVHSASTTSSITSWLDAGVGAQTTSGASSTMNIYLRGFVDAALGIGFNPLV